MVTVLGISGMQEMNDSFVLLKGVVRRASMAALREGGDDMKKAWQKNILDDLIAPGPPGGPPDPRSIPAVNYHDSIEVGEPAPLPYGAAIEIKAVIQPRAGQPFEYPAYVEFGTTRMKGNPVMTRAYDEHKAEVTAKVQGIVEAAAISAFPSRWTRRIASFSPVPKLQSFGGRPI